MITYSRHKIGLDDIWSVIQALRSDWLTQGPKVREFEQALCAYTGAAYAAVFANGTAALHGAYAAAGVDSRSEAAVPANTFMATANAALYLGAKVRFIDIDPRSGNVDLEDLRRSAAGSTTHVVPVHYAGHPVDMQSLAGLARERGWTVIEDASHALGARYQGRPVGSCQFSRMTTFSFHPLKSITTAEGGAVMTNDAQAYERLCMFRQHGVTKKEEAFRFKTTGDGAWYHEMHMLGFNYRLSDLHCALGLSQLRKVDRFIARRREIAGIYRRAFAGMEYFDMLADAPQAEPSWHLFPILLRDGYIPFKKEIFEHLHAAGIGVQSHYIPVCSQPYYRDLGFPDGHCLQARRFAGREISLPIHPAMSGRDVQAVIGAVTHVFRDIGNKC